VDLGAYPRWRYLYDFSNALNSKITRSSTEVTEKTWITGNNARLQSVKIDAKRMVNRAHPVRQATNHVTWQYDYDWGVGARVRIPQHPPQISANREFDVCNAHLWISYFTEESINRTCDPIDRQCLVLRSIRLNNTEVEPSGMGDPGCTIRGNLTRAERVLLPAGNWYWTEYHYDELGNRLTTTDPGGHTTTADFATIHDNTSRTPLRIHSVTDAGGSTGYDIRFHPDDAPKTRTP